MSKFWIYKFEILVFRSKMVIISQNFRVNSKFGFLRGKFVNILVILIENGQKFGFRSNFRVE